ncbi:MAG TPA: flagellar basal body rod protein FlgC [Deltaproteobacteria bacterium]|nr:flagellar basal body rod protein FlgC [Deltaproteobacteria bacterium]
MDMSDIVDIATSGLRAQRARMTVTASNIANAETTRTAAGGPFRRRDPVFETKRIGSPFAGTLARKLRAVAVSRIQEDQRDPITRYLPHHPDANEEGYVEFPNVNLVEEQANLVSASRGFQANLLVMQKVRGMAEALMRIGQ